MDISRIKLCKIKLQHASFPLENIADKVMSEMMAAQMHIRPGMRIAVACGSRGIASLAVIVKSLLDYLKSLGAQPFIIPAMGSHGGATAEGQAQVLNDYGICEESMGVPVLSSLEVVQLGSTGGEPDVPVFMDKYAYDADGIIVVNRVKAHTDFHGTHESGIVKMLAIGLGKHRQAMITHRYGADGLRDQIPRVSARVIESGKILGGLAILEDGYDETCDLVFAPAKDIFAVDKMLLERSRKLMARLPFDKLDILIVDEQGKNFSGTGMDTNVIGRIGIPGQIDSAPDCGRIIVRGLSEESHGNALGIGLADITTQSLVSKIDWKSTYANVVTSGFLQRGFLPIVAQSDREAIEIAAATCGVQTEQSLRLARIRNTLHLDEMYISESLLHNMPSHARYEQLTALAPMRFTDNDALADF